MNVFWSFKKNVILFESEDYVVKDQCFSKIVWYKSKSQT